MSIEQVIQANTDAILALTAQLAKGGTAKTAKPAKETAADPTPAAVPQTAPAAATPATTAAAAATPPANDNDPEYKKTKEAFLSFGGEHGKEETVKVLSEAPFKASRLGEIKPEHYVAFRNRLEVRANELKTPAAPKGASDLV